MLSRLAIPHARKIAVGFPQKNPWVRVSSVSSTTVAKPNPSAVAEERDLVNFPHPKMAEFGGKVRMGIFPDEWFQFFYRKTGVTGPYLFGTGLITFLCSKEWYIMEHEFYVGLSLAILYTFVIKKFGSGFAEKMDKEGEAQFQEIVGTVDGWKKTLSDNIKQAETERWRSEAQDTIFDVKHENIGLQLEAEYRKRLMQTYNDVKKRLDYHVLTISVTRQVHHKHMVNWIIDNVVRSITPQQEAAALKKCISDLKALSLR